MATRKTRAKTTPVKEFLVIDPDGNQCCGQTFPTYEAAMQEARDHADGYGSNGDSYTWQVAQLVGELGAEYNGVTFTETKV